MKIPDFLKGTNFYVALLVVIGGLWAGFTPQDANGLVQPIFALVSFIFALRLKLKGTTRVSWADWWANPNTKNYLSILVLQIVPNLPVDFVKSVTDAISHGISKNWTALISSMLSAVTILYFWLKGSGGGVRAK